LPGVKTGKEPRQRAMFTIEFVVFDDSNPESPRVVEKVTSGRFFLYDVEHLAKLLLKKAKRRSPKNSVQGYQILDGEGRIVARSWKADAV
jgi:hypothetical protein